MRVRAKLTITSAPRITARNRPFTVTASIAPAHFGRIGLTIARKVGTRWVTYRTFTATGVSRVRFRISLPKGTFRMHVVHSDTKHLWSRSAYRLITVR